MICELGSLSFWVWFEDEGIVTSLTLVSITAPAVSAATGGVTVDGVGVPTGDNTVAALAALMLTCFSPSLFKFMTCELRSRKKIKRFFLVTKTVIFQTTCNMQESGQTKKMVETIFLKLWFSHLHPTNFWLFDDFNGICTLLAFNLRLDVDSFGDQNVTTDPS